MHGQVKDVVVCDVFSSSKQDLEQSNRGPVLEKGWSSIMSYAYEFILYVGENTCDSRMSCEDEDGDL